MHHLVVEIRPKSAYFQKSKFEARAGHKHGGSMLFSIKMGTTLSPQTSGFNPRIDTNLGLNNAKV